MVEYVSKEAGNRAILASVCILVCCGAGGAAAETLPDPTRPPPSLGHVENAEVPAATGPVLQSVLISAGRKVAVISGQTVKLGDKYGDARLVKISDSEVVLRSGKDLQTLKLFPGIEKTSKARQMNSSHDNLVR